MKRENNIDDLLKIIFQSSVKIPLFQVNKYFQLKVLISRNLEITSNEVTNKKIVYILSNRQVCLTYSFDKKEFQKSYVELLNRVSILLKKIYVKKNIQFFYDSFLSENARYQKFFIFDNHEILLKHVKKYLDYK